MSSAPSKTKAEKKSHSKVATAKAAAMAADSSSGDSPDSQTTTDNEGPPPALFDLFYEEFLCGVMADKALSEKAWFTFEFGANVEAHMVKGFR